jgi:transposase-like protein
MGRLGYPDDIRLRAKALWIVGRNTDAEIAEQLGIARPGTICDWRREENWEHERAIIQKATEEKVAAAISETISEMNTRHLKEYQLLQTKGIAALKRLDPRTASEAQSMVDVGVRGERLVRGEPTEVREVRALMQANVQVLEVVVADVLKVLLDSGQIDGRAARRFADVFAEQVNAAPFRYKVEGGS